MLFVDHPWHLLMSSICMVSMDTWLVFHNIFFFFFLFTCYNNVEIVLTCFLSSTMYPNHPWTCPSSFYKTFGKCVCVHNFGFKYPNFLQFFSLKLCSKFWIDPHSFRKHYPQRERISSNGVFEEILQSGQQLVCYWSILLYKIHMIGMFQSVCRHFLLLILW